MRDSALESRLLEVLPIRNIRVARSLNSIDDYASVGALGAEALNDRVRANSTVAVSWGTTLQSMVNALESDYLPGVHLVPLVGGMTELSSGSNGEDLIRSMAAKMGASFSAMLAPVVVSSRETRDAFVNEPSIAEVLKQAANADIAIVGIGSKRSSSTMDLLHSAGLPDETYDALVQDMAGDMAARIFDIEGKAAHSGGNFEAGISAPVRTPRGRDIDAACGQLKTTAQKLSRAELDRLAEEKQAALG